MSWADPRGQHLLVGAVMLAFGGGGVLFGAVLTASGLVGTGFIDGPTAMLIGLVTMVLGWWQRRIALRYDPSDSQA